MSSEKPTLPQWLVEANVRDNIFLTDDQILKLIRFSVIWFTPAKLSKCIGLDSDNHKRFIKEFNDNDSIIRKIVDFARLKNESEINANAAARAKESATGLKMFRDIQLNNEIEEMKQCMIPVINTADKDIMEVKDVRKEISYFQELQDWIMNGNDADKIPDVLKNYWSKLNFIYDLISSFEFRAKGRNYIAKLIMNKYGCSDKRAYLLINEAIQFFNFNQPKDQWYNRLLEDLEKIKAIAWKQNDKAAFIDAVKEQTKINALRKDTQDIPPEIFEARVLITSHNPEDFGIPKVPRKEIVRKIKSWKLKKEDELRLLQEINPKYAKDEDNDSKENISK